MRIEVVGKGLEITDAIRAHAQTKGEKLPRYYDKIQQMTFTLSPDAHHNKSFTVELLIDVEHHDDFVCRASGEDLYALVDQVVQKGARQLTDFKEKLKTGNR